MTDYTKEQALTLLGEIKTALRNYDPELPTSSSLKGFFVLYDELKRGLLAQEEDFPQTIYNDYYETKQDFKDTYSNNLIFIKFSEIISEALNLKLDLIISDIYDHFIKDNKYHQSIVNPSVDNDGIDSAGLGRIFEVFDIWGNTLTEDIYMCISNTTHNAVWAIMSQPINTELGRDSIKGLVPFINSNTTLTIQNGLCYDDTYTYNMYFNSVNYAGGIAGVLQAAGSWVAGSGNNKLFSGAIAASTTYHLFLIRKTFDGTLDWGASTSLSPTLPTGYETKRFIGSIMTDGSAHIIQGSFIRNGNNLIFTFLSEPVVIPDQITDTNAHDIDLLYVPNGTLNRINVKINAIDVSSSQFISIIQKNQNFPSTIDVSTATIHYDNSTEWGNDISLIIDSDLARKIQAKSGGSSGTQLYILLRNYEQILDNQATY